MLVLRGHEELPEGSDACHQNRRAHFNVTPEVEPRDVCVLVWRGIDRHADDGDRHDEHGNGEDADQDDFLSNRDSCSPEDKYGD